MTMFHSVPVLEQDTPFGVAPSQTPPVTRQEFTLRCLVTITWAFAAFRRGWVMGHHP